MQDQQNDRDMQQREGSGADQDVQKTVTPASDDQDTKDDLLDDEDMMDFGAGSGGGSGGGSA